MTNCCDLPNPLIRDGVSQRQRQAPALPPDSIAVNGRDLADWLVFAHQLGRQIIYYDLTNQPQGTWHEFFEQSTPVQIALISKTRPQGVRDAYTRQLEKFLGDRSPTYLSTLLDTLAGMLKQIQQWYTGLDASTPLKSSIKGLVKTNLSDSLARLAALESHASTPGTPSQRSELYEAFIQSFGLTPRATALVDITAPTVTRFTARMELDGVFQVMFQNYRQIIQIAPGYLSDSLSGRQDHPPHLALYVAFLRLLTLAQADLNRITQRHLDFFYRQVLQLPDRPSHPDYAHLIFALAKFQGEYKLPADTAFNGGKDASGADLMYRLDQDIIIHKAQIASLKGLFLASNPARQMTGLHQSAIANSADGQGTAFPKEQAVKAWQPFGDAQRPQSALGLAIASDIFYLQEGDRAITLTFTFDQAPSGLLTTALLTLFRVEFSGEKDWIGGTLTGANLQGNTLTLTLTVAADQKPIGSYHADLPGARLATTKPVVRIYLNPDILIQERSPYDAFRPLKLVNVKVETRVTGVRNLILQNEQSVIDPTKPFQPFGSQPKMGTNFYIGSKEVFQKRLTHLKVDLDLESPLPNDWSKYYAAYGIGNPFSPGKFRVYALSHKTWQPSTGIEQLSLSSFEFTPDKLSALKLNNFVDTELTDSWNYQRVNGFMRLELTDDFLHGRYSSVLTRQVLASATNELIDVSVGGKTEKQRRAVIGAYYRVDETIEPATTPYIEGNAEPIVPNEPFTPVVRSLSLSYTAQANRSDCQLFHLHAFEGVVALGSDATTPFLPQYTHEGELLIGLADLDAPTALPLLVQVAEETAATDLERATVQWFYLKNNQWQPLQPQQIVSDTSNGLITSGIVTLAIPDDIQTGNTLLDANLYWLKVAVAERSRAICNIIGLYTQAARVTFSDRGNDPIHLTTPLEAGAIAKLVDPQPELKTIEQPYVSMGGQGQETSSQYYLRVSEHLRHKGRAVTIFDYERLVLEQFPQIYKVRCMNHSRITDQDRLQELVPGSVTLAVIPDLSQRTTTNDLEPKVNRNLLADIRSYLLERCSFVLQNFSALDDIYVINPRYEQIQVEFQVAFKSPYSANADYYLRELNHAIIRFLSPWTMSDGAEINFGGSVYRSSILNFVEEQPYVEHVLNFAMHQGNQRNLREVVASSARSILVSAPFSDDSSIGHVIQPIQTYPPTVPIRPNEFGYTPLENLILD